MAAASLEHHKVTAKLQRILGAFGEILDADHAAGEGKFGMQVEVDEGI